MGTADLSKGFCNISVWLYQQICHPLSHAISRVFLWEHVFALGVTVASQTQSPTQERMSMTIFIGMQ